jgi:hypothetical protein
MVSIKTTTKDLLNTLKLVKGAVRGKGVKALATTCEITVTDGKATFAVPGAIFTLVCSTKGTCKAVVPFLYFFQIVKDLTLNEIEIIINKNDMKIHNLTFNVKTFFFETDRILRTIHLPINYTDKDLLLLSKQGYTEEEIIFNKVLIQIERAEENLENNIMKAYKLLKQYGVPYEIIEKTVKTNLFSE